MPSETLNSLSLYHDALASLALPIPSQTSVPVPSLPQSKHIPRTRFLVDSFRPPSPPSFTYFLSHFHSDHYSGLGQYWSHGMVFASPITSSLLVSILKVPQKFVYCLPLNEPVEIDGVEVILVDANHCPGAVQFLFGVSGKVPESYVHTGDFRFHSSMVDDCFLQRFIGCDAVFLDTTYCNPKYTFPSQEESIDYVVSVIEKVGREANVLFLVATYVIGKEKILLEIARRCERMICVDSRKMGVLKILGYEENDVFTEDESKSDVHVVGWNVLGETWPYFRPNYIKMKEIMEEKGYSRAVGFVSTGWTYEVKRNKFAVRSNDSFEIHLVPYSEHSNYNELREYVKFLKPKQVIPTVGADVEKLGNKYASKIMKHFSGLVDEISNKKEFLKGFLRASSEDDGKGKLDVSIKKSEISAPEKLVDSESHLILSVPSSVDNDNMENNIQELKNYLPKWVTHEQLIDLISGAAGNIVDAVSNFYEREMDYHRKIFPCGTSLPQPESDVSVAEIVTKIGASKSECDFRSMELGVPKVKDSSEKLSFTTGKSPSKRKKAIDNKSVKKAKISSKPDYNGSKQSTITKFFNKNAASCCSMASISTSSQTPPISSSKEILFLFDVDQFISITGGNESSRIHAIEMLKATNGDVNMALDLHYRKNETGGLETMEQALASGDVMESEKRATECAFVEDNTFREDNRVADITGKSMLAENEKKKLVSLPLEQYNPVEHACWKAGEPAPYIHLARTFELVEAEKGKIKATSMLCNMFRSLLALTPEDVLSAVYLCTNKIAPDQHNVELNIGGSLVSSALEEACGTTRSRIREMYTSVGDLGDVAQLCRQTQKLLAPPPPLLITDVFSALKMISGQTGNGSSFRKKSLIVNLLRSCREKEIKYIVRTLVRNLRIGAMMKTILPALAQAVALHFYDGCPSGCPQNLKEKLQSISAAAVEAYNIVPDLGMVVPSLVENGIEFSSLTFSMLPGVPIKPMLAKITNGVPGVLDILQNKAFTCEYKYDGQRAQIHRLSDGSVRIFSRNGDETTSRFPDVVNAIQECRQLSSSIFVVDAEVVAVDRSNDNRIMSFQELASRERGRKDSAVPVDKIRVDVCVFAFDIMLADGENLIGLPLRERKKYLQKCFGDGRAGYLEYAKEITIEADDASKSNESTAAEINAFLHGAITCSCEGIMAKALDVDAEYRPSKRSDAWLKVKRDYVDGLNDSLDLVPIGAWHGNGRKAGWYSPFLLACYNSETEEYESVCRVMSGFSDSFYIEMKDFFSGEKILSKKPPYYRTGEAPDLWFSPSVVWAIRGADFSLSPVHQAAVGLVHPSRGISMRFPRFIRPVPDRNPEECSSPADIADMFNAQTRKMNV